MTALIEKDSPMIPLLILAGIFLIFLGGGLGLAYVGGVFTGKNEVTENDNRIAHRALPVLIPPTEPEPAKP